MRNILWIKVSAWESYLGTLLAIAAHHYHKFSVCFSFLIDLAIGYYWCLKPVPSGTAMNHPRLNLVADLNFAVLGVFNLLWVGNVLLWQFWATYQAKKFECFWYHCCLFLIQQIHPFHYCSYFFLNTKDFKLSCLIKLNGLAVLFTGVTF